MNILTPTRVWTPNGSYQWAVFHDPSVKYFGLSHIPYASMAIIIMFLVHVPVFVLLMYPCHWFQKCLNRFHLRSLALQAFVDIFQGYYKDGTNGTRDCRYFAPLLISLRLITLFLFSFIQDLFLYAFTSCIVLVIFLVLFALTRPYKKDVYNKTDIPLILILLFFFISSLYDSTTQHYPFWTIAMSPIVNFLTIVSYMCYWGTKRCIRLYGVCINNNSPHLLY